METTRTPRLQSAPLRLRDARGKDSESSKTNPRGEKKSRVALPGWHQVPSAGGRKWKPLPTPSPCQDCKESAPRTLPAVAIPKSQPLSRVPVSLPVWGQAPAAGQGHCNRDWALFSFHLTQFWFRLLCHAPLGWDLELNSSQRLQCCPNPAVSPELCGDIPSCVLVGQTSALFLFTGRETE